MEEGREQCLFQVKEQHGQEQRERRRHSGLAGQWLRSMSTWSVSPRCGVSGAVRRVGGEEGRSRAQDGRKPSYRLVSEEETSVCTEGGLQACSAPH